MFVTHYRELSTKRDADTCDTAVGVSIDFIIISLLTFFQWNTSREIPVRVNPSDSAAVKELICHARKIVTLAGRQNSRHVDI
jgi:hypothetical protein